MVAALVGQVVSDTKVVAPYTFPAYSYVYHSAAVPAFRSAAVHYAAPRAVQYSIPHAVQYVAAAPAVQAVKYTAAAPVAAVRAAPTFYSAATYSRPAVSVFKKVEFDDDDDDVKVPLAYSGYAGVVRDASLEDDDDWRGPSSFGYSAFDDDRYDFDDDRK